MLWIGIEVQDVFYTKQEGLCSLCKVRVGKECAFDRCFFFFFVRLCEERREEGEALCLRTKVDLLDGDIEAELLLDRLLGGLQIHRDGLQRKEEKGDQENKESEREWGMQTSKLTEMESWMVGVPPISKS